MSTSSPPAERTSRRPSGIVRFIAPLALGALALALWQWEVDRRETPDYVLPSPARIAQVFASAESRTTLFSAWQVTVKTAGLALLAAAIGGSALAIGLASSRLLELSLFPYAVVLQVTPLVAVAPLIVIWVGMEHTQLIWLICAWIVAFFPILANTTTGLRSVDEDLRDLFRALNASWFDRLRLLLLPTAAPYFLTGLKVSANLSLVGAVVAEFTTGAAVDQPGLASVLFDAQYRLDVPMMFAALALIALTGIAFYYAVHLTGYFLLRRWHDSYLPLQR
ncbi:MAG: ABC transporter permease [Planctomycetales bacterium]|nr:ABC transporter permease [Planctomycetales bacterium]